MELDTVPPCPDGSSNPSPPPPPPQHSQQQQQQQQRTRRKRATSTTTSSSSSSFPHRPSLNLVVEAATTTTTTTTKTTSPRTHHYPATTTVVTTVVTDDDVETIKESKVAVAWIQRKLKLLQQQKQQQQEQQSQQQQERMTRSLQTTKDDDHDSAAAPSLPDTNASRTGENGTVHVPNGDGTVAATTTTTTNQQQPGTGYGRSLARVKLCNNNNNNNRVQTLIPFLDHDEDDDDDKHSDHHHHHHHSEKRHHHQMASVAAAIQRSFPRYTPDTLFQGVERPGNNGWSLTPDNWTTRIRNQNNEEDDEEEEEANDDDDDEEEEDHSSSARSLATFAAASSSSSSLPPTALSLSHLSHLAPGGVTLANPSHQYYLFRPPLPPSQHLHGYDTDRASIVSVATSDGTPVITNGKHSAQKKQQQQQQRAPPCASSPSSSASSSSSLFSLSQTSLPPSPPVDAARLEPSSKRWCDKINWNDLINYRTFQGKATLVLLLTLILLIFIAVVSVEVSHTNKQAMSALASPPFPATDGRGTTAAPTPASIHGHGSLRSMAPTAPTTPYPTTPRVPTVAPSAAPTIPLPSATFLALPMLVGDAGNSRYNDNVYNNYNSSSNNHGFGSVVTLSADGQYLAVSAPTATVNGMAQAGQVLIYRLTPGTSTTTFMIPSSNTAAGVTGVAPSSWVPIRAGLSGPTAHDYFGRGVVINQDGSVLVVSARGSVGAYFLDDSSQSYQPLGPTMQGTSGTLLFGSSLGLSQDGTQVAVGAPASTGTNNRPMPSAPTPSGRGQVHVYLLQPPSPSSSTFQWVTMGSSLVGSTSFGAAVGLSRGGNVLVASAPSDTNSNGYVRAFLWNGSDWGVLGQDIVNNVAPASTNDLFGHALSVSMAPKDGNITVYRVAVGIPYKAMGTNTNSGMVAVYEMNASSTNPGSSWNLVGAPITSPGGAAYAKFGEALQLDGNILVIGSPGSNGQSGETFLYQYQELVGQWVQSPVVISGTGSGDQFGSTVSLARPTANGIIFAGGAVSGIDNNSSGYVFSYEQES